MTRFIITPERAVNLIMDSLYYSVGGEIFVPKLQSFKITELMEVLKEEFNSNAEIELIGLRPGEKLHELMINQSEIPRTYEFKDMFIITSSIHKYIQIREADYVKNGKKLMNSNFNEYCSKDVIISKSEIKDVFKELGFI
jgi:FlaA1/EpsC-like NDP-sugar epimerase